MYFIFICVTYSDKQLSTLSLIDISDISNVDWTMNDTEGHRFRTGSIDTTPNTHKATRNHDGKYVENKAGYEFTIL